MQNIRTPLYAVLLAVIILALGFVSGLGYQSWQHAQQNGTRDNPDTPDASSPRAPIVRNLRVSPDDRLLAFTAIYDRSARAGRFVFDLQTYAWNEQKSPRGWQDSLAQWNRDGRSVLFTREKIPRAVEEARPGLHREEIWIEKKTVRRSEPQPLFDDLEPPAEKTVAGFWAIDNQLVVKTRRESKALFRQKDGAAQAIDRSPGTYYQNRSVRENGNTVFYVVRDVSVRDDSVGLFRISNGQSRAVGRTFSDVVWAYLSENARWLVVCRYATSVNNWEWMLYRVSPRSLNLVKKGLIPEDVIAVYWSPDYQQILGAAGKSLWLISIPDLKIRKLGPRNDWNADDAAWLARQDAVIIAAGGHLWKVSTADGARREVWRFPNEYWN